jgi:hypothetical protein
MVAVKDLEHDPSGRGCALAGRVNDGDMDFNLDVCVACMTEEARHSAQMHMDDYGRWFSRLPSWIPSVDNSDCGTCEAAFSRASEG